MASSSEDHLWYFGFGSNMNIGYVENQKQVEVFHHTPAVLRNYKLAFNYPGFQLVEPSYANVKPDDGDEAEVHGVAFCMTRKSMEKMESMEQGYDLHLVTVTSYDGRRLNGFVFRRSKGCYTDAEETLPWHAPSKRYLSIILKGAREAGLKESYLSTLANQPTYEPPAWVVRVRLNRPTLSELPPITAEELARHKEDCWVSIMGYVVKPVEWGLYLHSFQGKDVTAALYLHFLKLSWYDNYKDGGPPYPLLRDLQEDALEYLTQFLDHYHAGHSSDGETRMGQILGHLVEFREQQESGRSTWKIPQLLLKKS